MQLTKTRAAAPASNAPSSIVKPSRRQGPPHPVWVSALQPWCLATFAVLALLALPAIGSAQTASNLLAVQARFIALMDGPTDTGQYDSTNFPTIGQLYDHQFTAHSPVDGQPHNGQLLEQNEMGFETNTPSVISALNFWYDGPRPHDEAGAIISQGFVKAEIQYLAVVLRQGQPPVPQPYVPVQVTLHGEINVFGSYDAVGAGWLSATSKVLVSVSGNPIQTIGFADGLSSFGYNNTVNLNAPMLSDPQNGVFNCGYLAFDVITSVAMKNDSNNGPITWDIEASADPTVRIDPAFAYGNYYKVVVSSNLVPAGGSTPIVAPVLTPAGCIGANFYFSFQTVSNIMYVVEYKDDLRTTNWVFHDALAGDGSRIMCLMPMTSLTQRFFRVRQP